MNKSAIEKFAVFARKRLREQVEQKALEIGLTAQEIKPVEINADDAVVINGRVFNGNTKRQRERLVREIGSHGFDWVMDEAAYTWFNRFIALRFMEVNGYLETGVRVFSAADPGKKDPDLLTHAARVDLPVDRAKILELQEKNAAEELYKYLIITQCNVLHQSMPFLFEKIADYTELLFPGNMLGPGSIIRMMVEEIPEEDWREVEIIGWLYQYYISEKKDEVFAGLKKNQKITKENIHAATQLFTPHWIVRYMVENTIGRLWLEAHPNETLKAKWRYYLEPVVQKPEVQVEMDKLINKNLRPEEIKVLDPACGSGHILVYAFELLYDIYKATGYLEPEIPKLILENNLYGVDIDNRAAQLACLAVAMKAREKSRTVLKGNIALNICSIQETNDLPEQAKEILLNGTKNETFSKQQIEDLWNTFYDAKEYGSIIEVNSFDKTFWEERLTSLEKLGKDLFDNEIIEELQEILPQIIKQMIIMKQKYDAVVTNPPYMGDRGMNGKLVQYIKEHYPESKGDLSTVFMECCLNYCNKQGSMGMINIPSWMFISSYENLRKKLINNHTIISMLHLGRGVFGSDFGTTSFIINKNHIDNFIGRYKKLFFTQGTVDSIEQKEKWFFDKVGDYTFEQSEYSSIPGSPIAYWASKRVRQIFKESTPLGKIAEPRQGLATSDNNRFLRLWYEVAIDKIGFGFENPSSAAKSNFKWFPYNKGGEFRKWYGNNDYLVNWEKDGFEIRNFKDENGYIRSRPQNIEFYFRASITWSFISSSNFGVRYSPPGAIFDVGGSSVFVENEKIKYLTAYLCSTLAYNFLNVLNPTLNFQVGNVALLPVFSPDSPEIKNQIDELCDRNIAISKTDWDSFETSWDFQRHPFLTGKNKVSTLAEAFSNWDSFMTKQFSQLKTNEEEINRIFIEIYGLQDELTPEIEDKDVTIRKADLGRDIRFFLSYAVGCMFGRYSLDKPGLIFAGGRFDPERYQQFPADQDGILPILNDEYFRDDIVARFVQFVKTAFGAETLAENLEFIARSFGQAEKESAVERIRKYFLNEFYKDHLQTYKNRPIYWLFTSGKEKAFNCLIYMHRYDKSTIARIRTDYLHELQGKLELEKRRLELAVNGEAPAAEKRILSKRLVAIAKQREELRKYDELLRHYADRQIEIDLDDGVRVNYGKLKELLAPVKGLEDGE